MMMTAQLEETLCHYEHRKPAKHALYQFFKDRYIKPESIAKAMGVSVVAVRSWLWGRQVPVEKFSQKLWELKISLDRWEVKKGRMFDARKFEK